MRRGGGRGSKGRRDKEEVLDDQEGNEVTVLFPQVEVKVAQTKEQMQCRGRMMPRPFGKRVW